MVRVILLLALASGAMAAAASFRQAWCLAPSSAEFGILVSLAQSQSLAGHLEAAIETLGRAQKLSAATSAAGRASLAQLHIQIASALLKDNRLDLALAQLLRARRDDEGNVDVLLTLATLENNLGAYSDAVLDANAVLRSAAAREAQRSTAAAIAGLAYKNAQKNDEAIRSLKQSVEILPNEIAYLALAEAYEMSNRVDQAIEVLDRANKAIGGSQKIQLALGRTLVDVGNTQRGFDILVGLTEQAPEQVEGWRWRAQAESALGHDKESAESLQKVERLEPGYPNIAVMLAQALLKVESPDYERALRALDHAAETTPGDADVFYLRGKVYFSMGRFDEAIKSLQRSIELNPTVSLSYYLLGRALQKVNRESEAQEAFEKVRFLKGQ